MSQYKESSKHMSYKQVAKWIKSKGRGKLRNYCTMCTRQFRDKKGLKAHMGSTQHLEQMRKFNENPEFYLKKFSNEFQKGYLDILKRMYGNKKVFARTVYTEYCHILHHRHLNSTYWSELDKFIEHLGKEKICEIEKGPKGYYVQYLGKVIENNNIIKDKEEDEEKKKENEETKNLRLIQKQIKERKKLMKKKKKKVINITTKVSNNKNKEVKNINLSNNNTKKTISFQLNNKNEPKKRENIFKKKKKKRKRGKSDKDSRKKKKRKLNNPK